MSNTLNRPVSIRAFTLVLAVACTASLTPVTGLSAQSTTETAADSPRPMTFLDVQEMRSWGSPAPSPDGGWLLHTVTTPDWQADDAQTDIHIVSLEEGTPSSRRLTFSEADDTDPTWSPDGDFFVFRSNRDAPSSSPNRTQLYLMRTDGGEARRITDASEGVSNFAFSPEGRWLVFRSGERGEEQLHRLPTADLTDPSGRPGGVEAEAVTSEEAGVQAWEWAPDGERIYYIAPDSVNEGDRQRREKGFTVDIRNQETPLSSLRMVEMGSLLSSRLAGGTDYSVTASPSRPTGDGWASPAAPRSATSGTSPRGASTRTSTSWRPPRPVERLTETYEGVGGLVFLSRRPVGGLLGSRRADPLHHDQQRGLPPAGGRPGRGLP
jgi:dipeptidyl aminopeptidase/acylaminoacyl peptidase